MPTIPSKYDSGIKAPEKHSPASQLAQLEREQRLRQEDQGRSTNSPMDSLVEDAILEDENIKNETGIRVRFDQF